MSETQEVLDPRRPRRRVIGVLLWGIVPLALAGSAGVAAGTWWPSPDPAPVSLASDTDASLTSAGTPDETPKIVAAGSVDHTDLAASVQAIKVTVPVPVVESTAPAPAKKPTAASTPEPASKAAPSEPSTKAPAKKSDKKAASPSFTSYCASPQAPYGAAGGPKALMAAANHERARLGIAPLSWSGSLASASASWSQAMASKDDDTAATMDALAHNPNRPGAENVAVSSSSGGVSEGAATNRAHSGWMYSNGHCLNLMNPAYSQMGAGSAATSDGTTWYTTANYR